MTPPTFDASRRRPAPSWPARRYRGRSPRPLPRWASLWTDRAVAYRALNGIEQRSVAIAVVVQRMVPAAATGVLFTANPVTGRRREAVIEAAPGLGETVVSGAVDPDRFVVDAGSGRTLERRRAATHQRKPCLGDDRIIELARAGHRCSSPPAAW
jgi:rifampicin phosphotransferase